MTKRTTLLILGGTTALAVLAGGSGLAVGTVLGATAATPQVALQVTPSTYRQQATASSVSSASAEQQIGVVTILTDVYYGSGAAAGTGMVITSDGQVLTNNHVISGATTIEVTVESTGDTYTAVVLGSDAENDVALLQLVDDEGEPVAGLDTVTIDDSGEVAVGDTITDVGNAEGTGDLVAASGTVTAVDQEITIEEKALDGLIELDADVVPGDSGGPVLDADGEVIGIATAASIGTRDITGWAIDIVDAMAIVDRILAGDETGTITIGLPAFLGVSIVDDSATIGGVLEGTPAADAGLVAGDTIVGVNGAPVASGTEISAAIAVLEQGDRARIDYLDVTGARQSVDVTLIGGPAS